MQADSRTPWIPRTSQGNTTPAALSAILAWHGVKIEPNRLVSRLGHPLPSLELIFFLSARKKCGLSVTPAECNYEELLGVSAPFIVLWRTPGQDGIEGRAVFEVSEKAVLLADTREGRTRLIPRPEFEAAWTGDIVIIAPDPAPFQAFVDEIKTQQRPWVRLRRTLGLNPPWPKKVGFAAGALLAVALAWPGPSDSLVPAVLSAVLCSCFLLSIWLWLFASGCRTCNSTGPLVGGLPLAPPGVAFYGALLTALRVAPDTSRHWITLALISAAGVHVHLVWLLLRSRLRCLPCLLIGTGAILAAALTVTTGTGNLVESGLALYATLAVASYAMARFITLAARWKLQLDLANGERRAAREILAGLPAPVPGRVQLFVLKVLDCPGCIHYENAIRPALVETFGDALELGDRELGKEKARTPFYVVRGSIDIVLHGLALEDSFESLSAAIQAALNPALSPLRDCGGLHWVHLRAGAKR